MFSDFFGIWDTIYIASDRRMNRFMAKIKDGWLVEAQFYELNFMKSVFCGLKWTHSCNICVSDAQPNIVTSYFLE